MTGFNVNIFQLTRSRGAWHSRYHSNWRILNFNSHAHVERDIYPYWQIFKTYNFNSHAHVERDPMAGSMVQQCRISTHTLTWSVTCIAVLRLVLIIISTHTLTWSVTTSSYPSVMIRKISTHTLTWSVTNGFCLRGRIFQFQLTRSRGAWPEVAENSYIHMEISTHTLTWSVTPALLNLSKMCNISTHTLTWSVTKQKRKILI